MIGAVAFDFDGVLVDSNSGKRSAFFEIFEPLAGSAPEVEATLREYAELDRFGVIATVLTRLEARGAGLPRSADLVGELAERYNDICEEHAAVCPEISGASRALQVFSDRCTSYVNSATPEDSLRRIVTRRGWDGFFADILGRPRTKVENLLRVLDGARVRPDELLFVGDGPGDLAAALEVGCRFIGVRDDAGVFRAQGADVVDDLDGLTDLILAEEQSEAAAC